jgi:hypothetical protein
MLAAVIGLNLGLKAHIVCLVYFFHLPQWVTTWDRRSSILNDLVKAVTNVSKNREDSLQGFGLICSS